MGLKRLQHWAVAFHHGDSHLTTAHRTLQDDAAADKAPALARGNSVVSAAANNRLDKIAATQGAAMSAAAVFSLFGNKKKKKKKKQGTDVAKGSPGDAAAAAGEPAAASVSGGGEAAEQAVAAEAQEADMLDPDSIEYVTKKRRIRLELEAAEKKLSMVKADMRKRERTAKGDMVLILTPRCDT